MNKLNRGFAPGCWLLVVTLASPVSAQPPSYHMNGVISSQIPSTCSGTIPSPSVVIRVVLKDGIDISDPRQRNVKYRILANGVSPLPDGDDTGDDDKSVGSQPLNPYHVDLTVLNTLAAGSWAEIHVVLRDSRYQFAEATISNNAAQNLEGVAAGDQSNTGNFCGLNVTPASVDMVKKSDVRIFYVQIRPVSSPKPYPFNIILQPKIASETIMIIDPKIINNG